MNNIQRHLFLIPLLMACGQKAEHSNEICSCHAAGGKALLVQRANIEKGLKDWGNKLPLHKVKLGGVGKEGTSLNRLEGDGLISGSITALLFMSSAMCRASLTEGINRRF